MIPSTMLSDKCEDCKRTLPEVPNGQKFWLDTLHWTCLDCDIKRRPQRELEAQREEDQRAATAYKSPSRMGNPFGGSRSVWS